MKRLTFPLFFGLALCLLPAFGISQERQLPPASTQTVDFKAGSKSLELTYAAVAWGPRTWDSILKGVDVGGTRRWFFAIMKLHGKAQVDNLRLKSGRYALVLNPNRDGPATLSFISTRLKSVDLPRNLRGSIPKGPELGHIAVSFAVAESIVDPLEIKLQGDESAVHLIFLYGNQRLEKTLLFR